MQNIYKIYAGLGSKDIAIYLRAVNCNITPKLSLAYITHRVYISNIHYSIN